MISLTYIVSLPNTLNKEALRLMRGFRPSRTSAITGTGALQIVPDPNKPGVFLVYIII